MIQTLNEVQIGSGGGMRPTTKWQKLRKVVADRRQRRRMELRRERERSGARPLLSAEAAVRLAFAIVEQDELDFETIYFILPAIKATGYAIDPAAKNIDRKYATVYGRLGRLGTNLRKCFKAWGLEEEMEEFLRTSKMNMVGMMFDCVENRLQERQRETMTMTCSGNNSVECEFVTHTGEMETTIEIEGRSDHGQEFGTHCGDDCREGCGVPRDAGLGRGDGRDGTTCQNGAETDLVEQREAASVLVQSAGRPVSTLCC